MERLETILGAEAADAPLRPGRLDAVQVMNLHKAKGLEADVVMLAAPLDVTTFEPDVHVARGETGHAIGGLRIGYREGNITRVLAHPLHWQEMQAKEVQFQDAESSRLLYVATTRAKRELFVAQSETSLVKGPRPDDSMWRPLAPTLSEYAIPRVLPITPAPGRRRVERSAASILADVTHAATRRLAAAVPTIRFATVSEESNANDAHATVVAAEGDGVRGRGVAWGRAVHRSLEALGRGRTGARLRAYVRAVATEEALDDQVDALIQLVERTAASDAWQRLAAVGPPQVELRVMRRTEEDGVETITEGVIDAAVLGQNGWRVVDWKTDDVSERYTRQVDAYVEMLSAITGMAGSGTVERLW